MDTSATVLITAYRVNLRISQRPRIVEERIPTAPKASKKKEITNEETQRRLTKVLQISTTLHCVGD
jgi:hypothetical protein